MHLVKHLAIIPDGNRRWAKQLHHPAWYGHKVGIERFQNVIDWCLELGIPEVTFYTLSIQNFQRSKKELKHLFSFIKRQLQLWLETEAAKKDIAVRVLGRINMLPKDIQRQCRKLAMRTKNNKRLKVNLMAGYGGKEELIDAIKKLFREGQGITEKTVARNLWLNSNPDLVIRTSGEYRTSNFLLWQAAYSEWFFSRKFWPAFDKKELLKALKDYQNRERRYGK